MTETPIPAPDAAVQIVVKSMAAWPLNTSDEDDARAVVDALARAGWVHDPAEVERLHAVADAARKVRTRGWSLMVNGPMAELFAALDAAPTATARREV